MSIQSWTYKRLGPVKEVSHGNELTVCCPFCDGDTKYHMYINPTKDVWTCFKCGSSGRSLDLIMQVEGISAIDASRILNADKERSTFALVRQQIANIGTKPLAELPEWFNPLLPYPKFERPGWKAVYDYAICRGFSKSQIEFYGFGYTSADYLHRYRLIIPVEDGYYQARSIYQKQTPKYLNPEVEKLDKLFNHRMLGQRSIAVCEGCISAIAASSRQNDPPAIAILGKTATEAQMIRIANSGAKEVHLAFDAGTEKSDGVIALADYLHSKDIAVVIRSYKFGDPDECSEYVSYLYSPSYKLKALLERIK